MYYTLNAPYLLRSWEDARCVLVDDRRGTYEILPGDMEDILECCDGSVDFRFVLMSPAQRALWNQMIQENYVTAHPAPSALEQGQKIVRHRRDFTYGIHWSITGRCNLRCRHCYLCAPHQKYDDLSFAQMCGVIRQMKELDIRQVSLTGGEPLMHRDFWRLIEEFQRNGICVIQLFTNAVLVDDAFLERCKELGISWEFVISYDGVGTHDWLRGLDGVEEKTIASIRRIQQAGYQVSIETALYRGNLSALLPTYQLMKELGVSFWKVSSVQQSGEWRENGAGQDPSPEELRQHYQRLIEQIEADGIPIAVQLDGLYAAAPGGSARMPYRDKAQNESYCCDTCIRRPYLLPDGRLLPCPSFTDTPLEGQMPSLRQQSLEEILTSRDTVFYQVTHIKTQEVLARNPQCGSCPDADRCGGGCRALAVLDGSGMYGVSERVCALLRGDRESAAVG